MRRRSIRELQVAQYRRMHEHIDTQPHMTLSPEKHGRLWSEQFPDHHLHPTQTPTLLSPAEAFSQGFHAGARWGYRLGRRRSR